MVNENTISEHMRALGGFIESFTDLYHDDEPDIMRQTVYEAVTAAITCLGLGDMLESFIDVSVN